MGLITLKKEKFYRVFAPNDGIDCEILARGVRDAVRQALAHIVWYDRDCLWVSFGDPEQQMGFTLNEMSDPTGARVGFRLELEACNNLKLRNQ